MLRMPSRADVKAVLAFAKSSQGSRLSRVVFAGDCKYSVRAWHVSNATLFIINQTQEVSMNISVHQMNLDKLVNCKTHQKLVLKSSMFFEEPHNSSKTQKGAELVE